MTSLSALDNGLASKTDLTIFSKLILSGVFDGSFSDVFSNVIYSLVSASSGNSFGAVIDR